MIIPLVRSWQFAMIKANTNISLFVDQGDMIVPTSCTDHFAFCYNGVIMYVIPREKFIYPELFFSTLKRLVFLVFYLSVRYVAIM